MTSGRLDQWRGWVYCSEGRETAVSGQLMMYLVGACSNDGVKASEKATGVEFGQTPLT